MFTIGDLLNGRYRLDAIVGRGGMGRVWRAHDTRLEREVAIKEVTLPFETTPEAATGFYARVLREARNAAKVGRLEDVVTIFDVVEDADGRPWIVMDFLKYPTLQEHLGLHGVWSPISLAAAAGRLFAVVSAVHRLDIVHRDIKPANLMVREDGSLVILDFGIARATDDTVTIEGIVGTPSFMAPERLEGQRSTAAADAWSLGVVLYCALTGTSPFERDTTHATMLAVIKGNYPALPGDEPIHQVIRGLLQLDPAKRMHLDHAARLLGVTDTVVLPPAQLKKQPRRRALASVAVGLSTVAALITGVALLPMGGTPQGDSGTPTGSVPTTMPSTSQSAAPSSVVSVTTTESPKAQVVGNVFTSDTMRVEAPVGWNIDAQGTPPYANLSKEGEGYVQVTRLNGATLESLAQEQQRSLGQVSSLSAVSYPQAGMALWTHSIPRFRCWDFPCGNTLVWSTVVAADGGYVSIVYSKPAAGFTSKNGSDDARAIAAIRAVAGGVKLL